MKQLQLCGCFFCGLYGRVLGLCFGFITQKELSLHQQLIRKDMTTIVFEDNSPQAKRFISYARSLPFAKVKKTNGGSDFNIYESLDRAFADVRLMLDGKKKEKTLDELINELRNNTD